MARCRSKSALAWHSSLSSSGRTSAWLAWSPSAAHEPLGLATVDTPLGIILKVDERRETSMPGIYAAGDLANPLTPPSVTLATAHGAMAGIFAQQSMLV